MNITDYKIMSGEGIEGDVEDFYGTIYDALAALERKRCDGDRWASLWKVFKGCRNDFFIPWVCIKAYGCRHEGEVRHLF